MGLWVYKIEGGNTVFYEKKLLVLSFVKYSVSHYRVVVVLKHLSSSSFTIQSRPLKGHSEATIVTVCSILGAGKEKKT